MHIFICLNQKCTKKEIRAIRTQLKFANDYFDKGEQLIGDDEVRFSQKNQEYFLTK